MHRSARWLIPLMLAACGSPTESGGPVPLLTELPRELSPAEHKIIEGANTFAFDLLREATRQLPPASNAFLSPLSASMALAMAINGANGETFEAMQGALRLGGMTEGEINEGYRDLIALLGQLDSRTEMRIANSMWSREGLGLEQPFVDAGQSFFDADVKPLDFTSPDALSTINDWVDGKTNGRIPQLLDEIRSEEVLFLINAIYFKGKWRETFDPKDTQDGPFQGADGRTRTARLMSQTDSMRYAQTDDYQAVDLLYGNGAFAMTVLLPAAGRTPAQVLAGLSPTTWRELTESFRDQKMHLTLPRFRMEYSRQLNRELTALGMGIAFDDSRADFYRIADVRPDRLYLTRVEQKTFVEVNEEGTEAAAATSVGVGVTSAPPEMRVDRPFVFAIRERLSGTIVFLGVINALGE